MSVQVARFRSKTSVIVAAVRLPAAGKSDPMLLDKDGESRIREAGDQTPRHREGTIH